jgi:hypothetical protein
MKIANIIHETDLVNHTKVDYINYFNEPIEYDKIDKTLPTLYVGWVFMKKCNPNNDIIQNANILHNKIIGNELYWEFSYPENKASHVKGIENFVKYVPQFYFSPKYTYVNLDPVFFQLGYIEDLMDILPKNIDVLYNYKNEMVYILCDSKISGINLLLYEFFKFNISDILNNLIERSEIVYNDLDTEIYQKYYRILPNFQQLKRYLVTILKNS